MAAAKCLLRVTAEAALAEMGLLDEVRKYAVFVDRNQDYHRVKFGHVRPSQDVVAQLRSKFAAAYPDNDTRVELPVRFNPYSYHGVSFRVYDNS